MRGQDEEIRGAELSLGDQRDRRNVSSEPGDFHLQAVFQHLEVLPSQAQGIG